MFSRASLQLQPPPPLMSRPAGQCVSGLTARQLGASWGWGRKEGSQVGSGGMWGVKTRKLLKLNPGPKFSLVWAHGPCQSQALP